MVRLIKNIVIVLSTLLVVYATGGIGIVQHFCSCNYDSSPIPESISEACVNDSPESCCKSQETPEAIAHFEPSPEENSSDPCKSGGDCCSSIYNYLITDKVNIIDSSKNYPKLYAGFQVILLDEGTNTFIDVNKRLSTYEWIPPPKFGKELLCANSQLKSAPHIA